MFTIGPDLLNFLCVVMLRYHLKKQRKKDWLSPTSESFKTLQDIVFSNSILKDLSYLTKIFHTGAMEVYHIPLQKMASKKHSFLISWHDCSNSACNFGLQLR